MDDIANILPSTPSPCLSSSFSIFKHIRQIPKAQASQEQLRALTYFIVQLLSTLDREYRAGRAVPGNTSKSLDDLQRLLNEISAFMKDVARKQFLRSLFVKNDRIARIDEFYLKFGHLITDFQMSALFKMSEWQSRNEQGLAKDEQLLNNRLSDLEANQDRIMEALGIHDRNLTSIMICLHRRIDSRLDEDKRVRQFFQRTLEYLTARNGFEVEIESWMITKYEVERWNRIGFGGFGEVYKGLWNKTIVAIKVLKTDSGITPSSTAIRREIATWSGLRHTNILQFLGANELDDQPFIVMPYLKHGNARDYIRGHPSCDRLPMIHGVSLGLVYLHSQGLVHGDLKGLNVLIEDGGNAVLCDFGLSRLMADATSRTTTAEGGPVVGSWSWMAPERLLGGLLTKASDIYALGMTIYEIYVDETPFLGISHGEEFIDLVVRQDHRPERPSMEDAPNLSTEIWELAEKCWVKDPKKRPVAGVVTDTITSLLERDKLKELVSSPLSLSPGLSPALSTLSRSPGLSPAPGLSPSPSLTPTSPSISHRIRLVAHFDSQRTFHFDTISRDLKEGRALSLGRFTSASGQPKHSRHTLQFKSLVVSRSHAKLWFEAGGTLFVKDTGSSSGTFLNNNRLSLANTESRSYHVKDGDILRLGEDYPNAHEKLEAHNAVKILIELDGSNTVVPR